MSVAHLVARDVFAGTMHRDGMLPSSVASYMPGYGQRFDSRDAEVPPPRFDTSAHQLLSASTSAQLQATSAQSGRYVAVETMQRYAPAPAAGTPYVSHGYGSYQALPTYVSQHFAPAIVHSGTSTSRPMVASSAPPPPAPSQPRLAASPVLAQRPMLSMRKRACQSCHLRHRACDGLRPCKPCRRSSTCCQDQTPEAAAAQEGPCYFNLDAPAQPGAAQAAAAKSLRFLRGGKRPLEGGASGSSRAGPPAPCFFAFSIRPTEETGEAQASSAATVTHHQLPSALPQLPAAPVPSAPRPSLASAGPVAPTLPPPVAAPPPRGPSAPLLPSPSRPWVTQLSPRSVPDLRPSAATSIFSSASSRASAASVPPQVPRASGDTIPSLNNGNALARQQFMALSSLMGTETGRSS
jgi:hypothetical protein